MTSATVRVEAITLEAALGARRRPAVGLDAGTSAGKLAAAAARDVQLQRGEANRDGAVEENGGSAAAPRTATHALVSIWRVVY